LESYLLLKVGFIGLGDMGSAIARRIIDAGFPTALWARRDIALQPFDRGSFTHCATVADVGRFADVVGLCVFNDADVRQVLLDQGLLDAMKKGSVVLIHSTVSPELCETMAAAAAVHGIALLDAPVSGGREGALAGKLAVMVGGDAAALEQSRPVLECFSSLIRLMGPIGSGQRMKVLNNMLTFANGRIANLAIETGQMFGLEPYAVMDILRTGGARSFALDTMVEKLLPDEAFQQHAFKMIDKERGLYKNMRVAANLRRSILDDLADQQSKKCVPSIGAEALQQRRAEFRSTVMEQRLDMLMVSAKNIAVLRKFYEEGLGWKTWIPADDNQTMYKVGSSILVFLPEDYLAAESGVAASSHPKSFWAIFSASKEQAAATYAAAIKAGAKSTSGLRERDYDVFSGYFADPEGNGWEVVWSPHMAPNEDGNLALMD
jgi:3-hydroxyisobutyrate dehydrogenase